MPSWEASPVNQFRLRVDGKLKPIRDGYGPSSRVSSLRYDPVTSSWRTYPGFSPQAWAKSSVIFPPAGTMRSGVVSPQKPLERPTSDGESSLLPTPAASGFDSNRGGAEGRVGKIRYSLQGMARTGLWPTPTANRRDGLQSHGKNAITGQLNPTWVEWLMGFPAGWTDLEPSETP